MLVRCLILILKKGQLVFRFHWLSEVVGSMSTVLVWSIAAGTIAGVLFRPKEWPEAVWACLGAFLLIVCGLLPLSMAGRAIAKGTDVYLFLTGMMMLTELARREGVFDWLATVAVAAAKGSRVRLFTLVYLVGVGVTVFLSNDATAVVLTPAVYAAVRKSENRRAPLSVDLRIYPPTRRVSFFRSRIRRIWWSMARLCRL